MGDILPHKRQTVVDRLRRRIEHYRRHQSHCQPRYNNSLNGLLEHHHQDTLLLRQRFLEAKAKKNNSNNNKKSNSNNDHHHHHHNHHKSTSNNNNNKESASSNSINNNSPSLGAQAKYKRVADISIPSPLEAMTAKVGGSSDDCSDQQHAKLSSVVPNAASNSSGAQNLDPGLTQFSVEIVQQFTSPGQAQGQQIQTNVTVTAVAGSIKTSDSPVPNAAATCKSSSSSAAAASDKTLDGATLLSGSVDKQTPSVPPPPLLGTVECKQEPKYDLEHCSGAGLDAGHHSSDHSFTDSFSNFIDDSNDDDINLNFNTDTLNYLIDALPQDLMTAYLERFEDDVDDVKTHDDHHQEKDMGGGHHHHHHQLYHHHHHQNHQLGEMGKSGADQDPLSSMNSRNQVPFCTSSGVQSCPLLFSSMTTSCNPSTTSMNPLSNLNPLNQGRIPPYGTSLGLDFALKEQSPAAQTLKQMAEQHQNMQQKQQHLGMGLGSSSPFATDFGLGSSAASYGTGNMDFLGSSTGAPFMQGKGAQNSLFPFGPNPLSSMNSSMMKQDPMFRPSPRQGTPNMGHHILPHHVDMRKQPIQAAALQRLSGVDQKPGLGHSPGPSPGPGQPGSNVPSSGTSPGPCSTPGSTSGSGGLSSSSPLSFGATKPLTHFSDPQQTPVNNNNTPSPVTGMQQFMHGGGGSAASGVGTGGPSSGPPPQPPSQQAQSQQPPFMNMASGARLQASQSQQMQVNRNPQQQSIQVSQGQHVQMGDLKGQQQQQMLYNFSQQQQATANGDHYQLNVNQSQSVSFGGQMSTRVGVGGSGATPGGGTQMMSQPGGQQMTSANVGRSPAMMHQQHMIRQQKMSHLQQQQQRLPQFTANPRPPPPEYNAQVSAMGHQMAQQQQGMLGMMSQNPVFVANGQLRANVSGPNMLNGNSMMANQASAGLGSRGASPGGSPGSMLNSGANHMNHGGGRVSNPSISSRPAYPASMLRDQRPPNVNVGPDGLNIGLRGMTSQDWRQMMVQNQAKFQSLGGGCGPTNCVHGEPQNQVRPRPVGPPPGMMGPQRGYQQQQAAQPPNAMQMMGMHHQAQARMGGITRAGALNSSSSLPTNATPPVGHPLSMMQQQSMQSRCHPNQAQLAGGPPPATGGLSSPIMTMQMSSSVTMSTGGGFGLTTGQNNNGSSTSLGSDINFDFLDSLSGPSSMDGGAFEPNDADLLNSFDSVMHNGASTLNLLEGL